MAKQTFMRGAMILATAGAATKIMGMMIQMVIARKLGAQGFGLFQTINPIFYMLLTLATLALPTALSKVIAENLALGNMAKIRRALTISNATVIILSLAICSASIYFAPLITTKWLDPRASLPFMVALLRIPVVCLSSVMSGYYMGTQNQTPPAIAWVIETVVRTAMTIPLILGLSQYGIEYGALAVMIGAGAGETAGYLFMMWRYLRKDRPVISSQTLHAPQPANTRETIRDLAQVALPTTVTNLSGIIAFALEPVIIYFSFAHVGVAKTTATALYGSFGMAMELLFLPTVLSASISAVVIPAVSEAAAMKNARLVSHRLNQVIQVTFLIALPATVFFILSGHDLAHSLYKDQLAGALLSYMAPVCVFLYILDPLSAVLQGLNKASLSTGISLLTSGIRVACIYYFISQTGEGIYGIATAIAISGIVSTLLSMYCVRKFVSLSINVTNLAKMIIATGLATIPIHKIQVWHFTQLPMLQVFGGLFVGGIIYVMALLYLGVFPIKTIENIPGIGPVLARTLLRMPFVS